LAGSTVALVVVDGLAEVAVDELLVEEDGVVELVALVVGRSSPPLHAASPSTTTAPTAAVHDHPVHVLINAPSRTDPEAVTRCAQSRRIVSR
jgi:hypothetical protein